MNEHFISELITIFLLIMPKVLLITKRNVISTPFVIIYLKVLLIKDIGIIDVIFNLIKHLIFNSSSLIFVFWGEIIIENHYPNDSNPINYNYWVYSPLLCSLSNLLYLYILIIRYLAFLWVLKCLLNSSTVFIQVNCKEREKVSMSTIVQKTR